MKKRQFVLTFLLLIAVVSLSGCDINARDLLSSNKEKDELVKVEIVFTDGQKLVTYVKDSGMESSDARLYISGKANNNFYDARGNIIGAFNYQRVLYIRILPASSGNNRGG